MRISSRRVTALMLSLVCSVEKTRCPVCAARTAISAVSKSRISPTSTTSGSWRSTERKSGGKSQADLLAHLDLDGAFELILDRVLERDDFAALVVGLGQGGIEGGGLAAAGWAGEQHHSLGQAG